MSTIFDAMLEIFRGGKVVKRDTKKSELKTFEVAQTDAEEEIRYSYCTEYIIERNKHSDPFMPGLDPRNHRRLRCGC